MTVATMSNIALAILCFGVIIQSLRLSKRLRAVADGSIGRTVTSLDHATNEARTVLEGLRHTLSGEGAEVAQQVNAARELAEELGVMVGIADAMANRLSEAGKKDEQPVDDHSPVRRRRRGCRGGRLNRRRAAMESS